MDEQKPSLYPGEEPYYRNNHKITPPPSRRALQIVSVALAVVVVIAIVLGMLVFRLATTQEQEPRNSNPLAAATVTSSTNPQIGETPTPVPTATPLPTDTPLPVSPTPTPLPTGISDCSGGQSVGWKKWSSNPANAWNDTGTTIVNTTDTSDADGPTLIGPPCGLLQRGSRVTIVFQGASGDGNLYLMVQGADLQGLHWYDIGMNLLRGLEIDQDKSDIISNNSSLNAGQSYTFTMEIAANGTLNLLDGNGGVILQAALSFIPNGQWGLETFYGSFSVSSVVVH